MSDQLHAPAALPPGKEPPGTHWTWGWVDPRAGLDEKKIIDPSGTWTPTRRSSSPYPVAIPTELSRLPLARLVTPHNGLFPGWRGGQIGLATHGRQPGPARQVGIATGYGLHGRGVRVRVPVGTRFLSSPLRPDQLWGSSTLLSSGYRGLFTGDKSAGVWSWPLTN
jgi:hypothetical protein